MFKRKSLIFCIAVVAIVCLFASTDVLAWGWPPPEPTCKDADYGIIEVLGDGDEFPLVITSENQGREPYRDYVGSCSNGFPCTVFAYEHENSECKLEYVQQALPDPENYCPDDAWDILNPIDSNWEDAGEGGFAFWYKGDMSVRVLETYIADDGFFIVTTNNVAAHPAALWGSRSLIWGKPSIVGIVNRTVLAPDCGEAPVMLSSVSTTTPDGCTLTIDQRNKLDPASAECPDGPRTVFVYDTDEIYLAFPSDGTDCEVAPYGLDLYSSVHQKCMKPFRYLSDESFGRVSKDSTGWYYWNGKWYSYTY